MSTAAKYDWLTINGTKLAVKSAHLLKSFAGIHAVLMVGERDTRIPVDFAMDEDRAKRIVQKLNGLGIGDYEFTRGIRKLPAKTTGEEE